MKTFSQVVGLVVIGAVILFGISLLLAFPVKWLINGLFTQALILAVFGVTKISVWTAMGLNLFTGILFKPYAPQKEGK